MLEWFNKLQPAQATIVAAIFGALVTILIAVLTLGIKDYFLPLLTEKRTAQKRRNETFKIYANSLIVSSITLLYRLNEILSGRGHFLLNPTPRNEFLEYKYRSTPYRFCCFLGWIRVASMELSFVEANSTKQYKYIQEAITKFEKKLADGQGEEIAILEDLSSLWNIDISNLKSNEK